MEIILTASPSENPILPVLKHKKIMNGASRWITASLMLWSHPLRSLNLIPSIIEVTNIIHSTTGKYFATVD